MIPNPDSETLFVFLVIFLIMCSGDKLRSIDR